MPPRFKVPAHSDPVKRWNFRKANWKRFCLLTGESVERLPPPDTPDVERAYQGFRESLISVAKQCIPRGSRKNYVPCWGKECELLYRSFIQASVGTDFDGAASLLLSRLQQKKQERWEEAVNSIDFSHSSRKAWRTINKLTGRSGRSSRMCPVWASSIASKLVKNGAHKTGGRESTRFVNKQLSDLWKIPRTEGHSISESFRPEEFAAALRRLKPGNSPGLDSIFSEFILHAGSALKSWFSNFLTSCMGQLKIPKIWRRALVVAIPKPERPLGDPKSYRPVSLLCVHLKILERLIYAHVETFIDPLLPQEQAGFRHQRSAVDQVTLLTQDIEDSFAAKKKAGAVFVDLTAAYDTVWHRGLTCKLLRLLPDRHMVQVIMEMVGNRSFTLTTGYGQRSRFRHLKNGVPQGPVLAPLLFNIHISDLPTTISRKYAYANDLAIMHADGDW